MQVSIKQLQRETNQFGKGEKSAKKPGSGASVDVAVLESLEKPFIKAAIPKNILGDEVNRQKRKEMIASKAFEPEAFAYERAIGKNDSLYSNFTELIALTKRKVGRIVIIQDGKRQGFATGFMVSSTLLLTNWHVFENAEMAEESEVHFFYEFNTQGQPQSPVIFKFDNSRFFNDKSLDYCFVGLQPTDVTGKISLQSIGYLFLDKTSGKIGDENVEKLNIIHHPQGDYKQISIRENTFSGIDDTKIFYQTDTAQGSSGSPVFNDQWQVVGLHHKSVPKMNAAGDFLDKDNKVIPIIDEKIDVSRVVWLKNEGIRISVILKHLFQNHANNSHLAGISVPPQPETLSFSIMDGQGNIEKAIPSNVIQTASKEITISVPFEALNSQKSIDIRLSTNGIQTADFPEKGKAREIGSTQQEWLEEVAKVDREKAVDFKKCTGYDPKFLGTLISLPQPQKAIASQIALLKNKSNELKYFKYSVIFNAFRKMPLMSAVNVEGDATKRLDNSKRKDVWLRDERIDKDCQLTDKFYEASGFDKGHMGRFEDANWDTAPDKQQREENALRNGIYTCFYTNACPQVPGINRLGDNLWGKLEKAILEQGVKKEAGKQARMTVFNGPIFDPKKERMRLKVTIPMQFFKIILWLNDAGKLKATAFTLSQEMLVSDDQFDESMSLVDEALDIDKLVTYKRYQCSIKSLSKLTNIDFKHIEKYDTYISKRGSEETLIEGTEGLML